MPKYSILIPAYNAEKYLKGTVESILKQRFNDYEIIIANDGSIDNTSKICKNLAEIDSRINIFEKSNEGLMKTRFFLYQKAKGDYIICCDADDTWEPNTLEIINANIEKYCPDVLMFSYYLWNSISNQKVRKKISIDNATLYKGEELSKLWEMLLCTDEINSLWSKVISKEVLPSNWEIPIVSHGEDKLQMIEIINNSNSVLYIPDALYNYRIDNDSMTRTFNDKYFNNVITVHESLLKKLAEKKILTEKTITKLGGNFLELFVTFLVELNKFVFEKDKKSDLINKYTNEEIFIKIICAMKYKYLPTWHKAMLFMVRNKQFWLINFLYIIKSRLKGKK